MALAWFENNDDDDLEDLDNMGSVSQSTNHEKQKDEVDMSWFDSIIHGANSKKDNKQIVSKLWEQIAGEDLVSRLSTTQQRHNILIWGRLAHRCDVSYPFGKYLNPIIENKKQDILCVLRYAMRHAVASYPPAFIALLGLQTNAAAAFKSNKTLLKAAFQIEAKDIIIDKCASNNTHQPAFYLCLDHHVSKIIISIRGTYSIADALTDANAIAKPYNAYNINGCVHEGMLAAARFVFDEVTNTLLQICNEFKEYQVMITGHSLGAGVAALLGFMYKDHPIVHRQNHLKVYAFASPPIVSNEFTNKHIGNDYITSIALGTDLVTRLSVESVKLMNLRLEIIMNCDKNTIKQCVTNFADPSDADIDEEKDADDTAMNLKYLSIACEYVTRKGRYVYVIQLHDSYNTWSISKRYNEFNRLNTCLQKKASLLHFELPYFPKKAAAFTTKQKKEIAEERVHHFEAYIKYIISNRQCVSLVEVRDFLNIPVSMSKAWRLLKILKDTKTPNTKETLFPLGRVLWLVPKAVMYDNKIQRRETLMRLNYEIKENKNDVDDDANEDDHKEVQESRKRYKAYESNRLSDILSTGWHNMTVGFGEFQELLDNTTIGVNGEKKAKRFDGSNYILCDATGSKEIFHELVTDLPDSLRSHMANRYLWGLDAQLTREKHI